MRRVGVFALFVILAAMVASSGATAIAAPADEVPYTEFGQSDFDAEVFMEVGATRAQVARVRAAIERDPAIARFAHLDHRDALAEFRRLFRRNSDLRDSVVARDLPESFRLEIRRGRLQAVEARYLARAGVDTVVGVGSSPVSDAWIARVRCSRIAYDLEVVMREDATLEEIDAVAAAAQAAPDVDQVEVADRTEVAAMLECAVPDADFGALPVLVHVDAGDPAAATSDALAATLASMPGVDTVNRDPELGESS